MNFVHTERPTGAVATRRKRTSLPGRVRAAWTQEARRDGVPAWLPAVVAGTPVLGTVLLGVVYLINRDAYYLILREDHPVEWAQFTFLLVTAVLAAVTAWRFVRRDRLIAGALLLVALGTFLIAGEEISWAQRAFAVHTPDSLAAVNEQAELNVHNINVGGMPVQSVFKLVSFVVAVVGLTLGLLTRGSTPRLRGHFWDAVAVPSYTIVGSLTMIGYWFFAIVLPLHPVGRYQEWAEASLYLAVASAVYAIARRAGTNPYGLTPAEANRARHRTASRGIDVLAVVVLTAVLVLTVVLAALTAHHGIIPLNAREGLG